ncbi:MAG: PQQ-binding-like beta-propeller repeat protein [Opitutae bacterium]|nr:PQQ-binding-like beta-propeller repeat protein [Opitutae bacterium]
MDRLTLFLLLPALLSGAESWPQWRGPAANGHAGKAGYPSEWSAKKNIAWKSVLPGRGHSSPVHDGDTIWVTMAIETAASEAEKKERLKANKGLPTVTVLSEVSLRALRIDPKSGKVLKNVEVLSKKQPQWVHKLNSYASPTPVIEDGKVYFHFGAYGNACIDAKTGKILWKNEDKALWVMHENGPGSSPLIWDNLMIFHLDGSDKQNIVALYKDSGKIAWITKRSGELRENPQLQKSYSTPIVETFNGKPILISCSADWVYGYEPRTGDELWKIKYGHLGFSNVARPVTGHGMIYLSTCFMKAEILAFRYEGLKTPKLAWRLDRGPKMPSPILVGKELYVINDGGILTCVDALTGDLHWRERLDGEFSSSPTYAGGLLYFSDQAGVTTVIKPAKTIKVVSKNELDGTAHMASFAPYGKAFLIRTNEALYRVESQ